MVQIEGLIDGLNRNSAVDETNGSGSKKTLEDTEALHYLISKQGVV